MGVLERDGEQEGRRGVDVPARGRDGGSGKPLFPEAPTLGDSFTVGMAIQKLEMRGTGEHKLHPGTLTSTGMYFSSGDQLRT